MAVLQTGIPGVSFFGPIFARTLVGVTHHADAFDALEALSIREKFVVDFINAVISFLLIATAVYFFVVIPVNRILARMRRREAPVDPTTKKCPECLSEVPIAARKCAFCTSSLRTVRKNKK